MLSAVWPWHSPSRGRVRVSTLGSGLWLLWSTEQGGSDGVLSPETALSHLVASGSFLLLGSQTPCEKYTCLPRDHHCENSKPREERQWPGNTEPPGTWVKKPSWKWILQPHLPPDAPMWIRKELRHWALPKFLNPQNLFQEQNKWLF